MLSSPEASPCLQRKDAVGISPPMSGRSSSALGQEQLGQVSKTSEAGQNELWEMQHIPVAAG